MKTTKLSAQNERLQLAKRHYCPSWTGSCGNVLCFITKSPMPHRHRGVWLFTKCFQPLESEATQVQTSEVTYCLVGLFWSKNWTRLTRECCCRWWEDFSKRWVKMGGFFRRPWIRICGWWGTGAGRREFLPCLAGGQACVRWLGWGTVEEEKGAES